MKVKEDGFVLSSGREVYANRGIIGINPELEISEGYDSGIHLGPSYELKDGQVVKAPGSIWTADEKREMADYMMRLWAAFGAEAAE